MRKLERRLEKVKEDFTQVKGKLKDVQENTSGVQEEEDSYEKQVRRIKETIEDLEIWLTTSAEEKDDQMLVSDSGLY